MANVFNKLAELSDNNSEDLILAKTIVGMQKVKGGATVTIGVAEPLASKLLNQFMLGNMEYSVNLLIVKVDALK